MKILASHQPNFLPYMGYIYKMYQADTFSFSNGVGFSRNGFHNYNYFMENGQKTKITVPVRSHSDKICKVELAEWEREKKRLLKRFRHNYSKYPHFGEVYQLLEDAFCFEHKYLSDLNETLLRMIAEYLCIETELVKETDLKLGYSNPSEDIVQICTQLGCNTYLSGTGAEEYLQNSFFNDKEIKILWSKFKEENEDSTQCNLSCLDYMMRYGRKIPDSWKVDKEAYHEKL